MKKQLREFMREKGITITDLSTYLDISRPTLYSYVEMYDAGKHAKLEKQVCDLFDFMLADPFLTPVKVIEYMFLQKTTKDAHAQSIETQIKSLKNSTDPVSQMRARLIEILLNNSDCNNFVESWLLQIDESTATSAGTSTIKTKKNAKGVK